MPQHTPSDGVTPTPPTPYDPVKRKGRGDAGFVCSCETEFAIEVLLEGFAAKIRGMTQNLPCDPRARTAIVKHGIRPEVAKLENLLCQFISGEPTDSASAPAKMRAQSETLPTAAAPEAA